MSRVLFLFIDGIGLGDDVASVNPFAMADLPTLHALSNDCRWLASTGRQVTERSVFLPLDPRLGVAGRPQSGTSQAALMTGQNIPQMIGRHYGPKPDAATRSILDQTNLFITLKRHGKSARFLDAYPPQMLAGIDSGKRLPSSMQYAPIASGQKLYDIDALRAGDAITAEYTGEEWRSHLSLYDIPAYTPREAGQQLGRIARRHDFAVHSHWLTDLFGHRGHFDEAVAMLQRIDGVMAGLLDVWDMENDIIVLTSDHGNMEHIGDRHHTENDVPCLVVGRQSQTFAASLHDLTDLHDAILTILGVPLSD